MIRTVLDTNVIVSALVFGGVPRVVLDVVEDGHCELFYSEPIQNEVRRVLAEKFAWPFATLREVLPVVWAMGELVVPRIVVRAVQDDPDDDRILECGLAANASFIVSGDRHLLGLRAYRSLSIITPRQFLQTYIKGQR